MMSYSNNGQSVALFAGVGLVLSGLFVPALKPLYDIGWFAGFFTSFLLYIVLMMGSKKSPKNGKQEVQEG